MGIYEKIGGMVVEGLQMMDKEGVDPTTVKVRIRRYLNRKDPADPKNGSLWVDVSGQRYVVGGGLVR